MPTGSPAPVAVMSDPCPLCTGPVEARPVGRPGPQPRYCAACRAKGPGYRASAKHRRDHTPPSPRERVCAVCDDVFVTVGVTGVYCSDPCRDEATRRRERERRQTREVRAERRADKSRRRALLRGARDAGAAFDPLEIFRRDGWRCHLCGDYVTAPGFNDPRSATLDHLVPVSAGGAHSPENVKTAHRGCNARRGARPLEASCSPPESPTSDRRIAAA